MSGGGGGAGLGGRGGPPLPDAALVHRVVAELKSHGIFDQFRKECIADVDTKPAYQNLRQRVESTVSGFLNLQTWSSDLNKNQLRERLRKHILDSNFLDQGVERIVDQVVNPKISSVFTPQVEEIVYKCLGLEKPSKTNSNGGVQGPGDLLPEDLEAVSPDSVKSANSSEKNVSAELVVEDVKDIVDPKVEVKSNVDTEDSDASNEEEFESPAFEPLEAVVKDEGNSKDSHLSGISDLTSHDSNDSSKNIAKVESELKSEFQSGDSHISQVSSGSNAFVEPVAADRNEFVIAKNEDSNNFSESVDVEISSSQYKFNDDNALDARQFFEESGKSGEIVKCESKNDSQMITMPEGLDSKISTDDSKGYSVEMAIDSSDANSVFQEKESTTKACTFENKIGPLIDTQKSDASNIKMTEEKSDEANLKKVAEDVAKSSKDVDKHSSHKHSRDRKDDSRHHSRSSHSRHSSSGRHSDRRHSSSHDKKESRTSESKSKDRHGRHSTSSTGDYKKDRDRDRHGSSSNRSSHKSSRESKHSSERSRHDSKERDKSKDSAKKSNGKDKSSESKHHDESKSHHSGSNKEKSSSKHSSRSSKSATGSTEDKRDDDKKRKGSKDDYCSTSVKNSKPRRSTDRDSNDGSSKFNKGLGSNSSNESNVREGKKSKTSSTADSNSNGNCSSGQSDSLKVDSVSITGGYIKSEFNIFEYASMNAFKKQNSVEKSPSSRFPEKSPPAKFPEMSPLARFPEKSPNASFPAKSPPSKFPEASPSSKFPEKSPSAKFPEKSPSARFPEKSPTAKFPEKSPNAKFPEKSKAKFSEKSPKAKFPEKSPKSKFPEKSPKSKFAEKSPETECSEKSPSPRFPENSPNASFPGSLSPTVLVKKMTADEITKTLTSKLSDKSPTTIPQSPEVLFSKTENITEEENVEEISSLKKCLRVQIQKLSDYTEMLKKRPIHIDSQLNPATTEDSVSKASILAVKMPKCASNIYEAIKLSKIRKQMKKMEQKRAQEAILKMEEQINLPQNLSTAFSGIPGPELEIACLNDESVISHKKIAPVSEEPLKYFDKNDGKLDDSIQWLKNFIMELEKPRDNKTLPKTIQNKGLAKRKKIANQLNKESNSQMTEPSNTKRVKPTEKLLSKPINTQKNESECVNADMQLQQSQVDIMGIILGDEGNFDSAVIHYKETSIALSSSLKNLPKSDEIIEEVNRSSRLKRKRTTESTSGENSDSKGDNFTVNNNIEENINKAKRRKNLSKSSDIQSNKVAQNSIPGSPGSDKSIENHIDGNEKVSTAQRKNSKNLKTVRKLNNSNYILRTNAKIP